MLWKNFESSRSSGIIEEEAMYINPPAVKGRTQLCSAKLFYILLVLMSGNDLLFMQISPVFLLPSVLINCWSIVLLCLDKDSIDDLICKTEKNT